MSADPTPASIPLVPGGGGQQISVNAVPANGFTGMVNVADRGTSRRRDRAAGDAQSDPGTAQTVTITAGEHYGRNAMLTFTGSWLP